MKERKKACCEYITALTETVDKPVLPLVGILPIKTNIGIFLGCLADCYSLKASGNTTMLFFFFLSLPN